MSVADLDLRMSRRALVWQIPLLLFTLAVGVIWAARCSMWELAAVLLLMPVLLLGDMVVTLRGRVRVTREGVGNRLGVRWTWTPWHQVKAVQVRRGIIGRSAVLVGVGGHRRLLAAPHDRFLARDREFDRRIRRMLELAGDRRPELVEVSAKSGSLVRTVLSLLLVGSALVRLLPVLWPPDQPWWPGRLEAARIPRACSALDPAVAQQYLGSARKVIDHDSRDDLSDLSRCMWEGALGLLILRYDRYADVDFQNGMRESADRYESAVADAVRDGARRTAETPSLGDEAVALLGSPVRGVHEAHVVSRRANVVVAVTLRSDHPAGRPAARTLRDAEEIARTALGRIAFG
ncbi:MULTISPECIES: hypothetical protein [Thermomonospora]|nr:MULTISPECIES: hypothetical protein [Thermomonospora]PKK13777.1 MAG: hypothetical protein BUE48_015155 [Thermomonospora sp. CIF 1]